MTTMIQVVPQRTNCEVCIEATRDEVEIDYISDHKLSGPQDLTAGDLAEIDEVTRRLIENEAGTFCGAHIDES